MSDDGPKTDNNNMLYLNTETKMGQEKEVEVVESKDKMSNKEGGDPSKEKISSNTKNIPCRSNVNKYVLRYINLYFFCLDKKLWISLDINFLCNYSSSKLLVFNELFCFKFKSKIR